MSKINLKSSPPASTLGRRSALTGLVLAGAPLFWSKPILDAVLLPAHAETSPGVPESGCDAAPAIGGPARITSTLVEGANVIETTITNSSDDTIRILSEAAGIVGGGGLWQVSVSAQTIKPGESATVTATYTGTEPDDVRFILAYKRPGCELESKRIQFAFTESREDPLLGCTPGKFAAIGTLTTITSMANVNVTNDGNSIIERINVVPVSGDTSQWSAVSGVPDYLEPGKTATISFIDNQTDTKSKSSVEFVIQGVSCNASVSAAVLIVRD